MLLFVVRGPCVTNVVTTVDYFRPFFFFRCGHHQARRKLPRRAWGKAKTGDARSRRHLSPGVGETGAYVVFSSLSELYDFGVRVWILVCVCVCARAFVFAGVSCVG